MPQPSRSTEVSLTEDEVVDAVARSLKTEGWTIEKALVGNAHGIDIEATRGIRTLHIEAKGSATVKDGKRTNHHQPHCTNTGIGAIGKTVMMWRGDVEIALALPDDRVFRNAVASAHAGLSQLGVVVYWVAQDGKVRAAKPHATREPYKKAKAI